MYGIYFDCIVIKYAGNWTNLNFRDLNINDFDSQWLWRVYFDGYNINNFAGPSNRHPFFVVIFLLVCCCFLFELLSQITISKHHNYYTSQKNRIIFCTLLISSSSFQPQAHCWTRATPKYRHIDWACDCLPHPADSYGHHQIIDPSSKLRFSCTWYYTYYWY